MNLQEYAQYDGLGLAELVRRKEVTPRELTDCALTAIEQVNPKLNAVIGLIVERAAALGAAVELVRVRAHDIGELPAAGAGRLGDHGER